VKGRREGKRGGRIGSSEVFEWHQQHGYQLWRRNTGRGSSKLGEQKGRAQFPVPPKQIALQQQGGGGQRR